jgi:thiol-disulfide isomerase/thioredoxin
MRKTHLYWLIALVVLVGFPMAYWVWDKGQPGPYDSFATCIADSGTKFYGAFWCPHCQAQKALFGKSEKKLPYVECSQPNGNTQTQVCIDAEIKTYPTWEYPDGTRETGERSFEELAAETGCALP